MQKEYFEIRLESIGGLGANLCGKLLGELGAAYLDFNSAAFSSYGSEKRGSAVKSHVRWCKKDKEILLNTPVKEPDILAVFHQSLCSIESVSAGVGSNTHIIVNTDKEPDFIKDKLKIEGATLHCIDALKYALETKSRVNMVMLGAIVKVCGFTDINAVNDLVKNTIGKKYPNLLSNNLEGVKAGWENLREKTFECSENYKKPFTQEKSLLGYDKAPIGGMNYHIGSTVTNGLSASREGFIPLFIFEKCIHCGLCDSTCPDMVFQFKEGEYNGKKTLINSGLDYHHCKGCLRCVEICPTEALVCGKESEHPDKKWFVRNKDLIVDKLSFESSGADAYITGESFLEEKRADGGVM